MVTNGTGKTQKLVKDKGPLSLEGMVLKSPRRRNKRKWAPAHIRAHQSGGRTYYYYCRGIDKEIYLGDADSILKAVKG